MPNFATLLYKSLDTTIAPMVYIMMVVNVLIGLFFATGLFMTGNESILYSTGVLLNKQLWGGMLLTTSSIGLYGFISKQEWAMQLAGTAGFMVWMFASISLFMAGHWYLLTTIALFHLLYHGYIYLATTTRLIFREPIYQRTDL